MLGDTGAVGPLQKHRTEKERSELESQASPLRCMWPNYFCVHWFTQLPNGLMILSVG